MNKAENIDYDLERTAIQIKTGSLSNGDEVQVLFWEEDGVQSAGRVYVTSSQYLIVQCMDAPSHFLTHLPSTNLKVWTITKLLGPRIVVHCNEVLVADITMSDLTCDTEDWRDDWSKDVEKISFHSSDTNPLFYRPKAKGKEGQEIMSSYNHFIG